MNFSDFFIRRPIFAIVLSVLIVIAGALALLRLPLSEYPRVAPTTVAVRAMYPGASPETVATTVSAPLEQEINGVSGMLYMSSQADADGKMTLTITFAENVDPERAQINVQNRVARALPRLPAEVQALGVVTEKTSPDMLMVVHLVSPNGRYDALHLTNYALLSVRDELQRLAGVGDVYAWGAGEYAMRVWLDPMKLAARSLTTGDVIAAIREQNVQVAAGSVGQSPHSAAPFQVSIKGPTRLKDADEFGDIIVKSGTAGQLTRLRDVARLELGASGYALRSLIDNQPAAGIQINQAPGASALAVSAAVRARMAELKKSFPEGI